MRVRRIDRGTAQGRAETLLALVLWLAVILAGPTEASGQERTPSATDHAGSTTRASALRPPSTRTLLAQAVKDKKLDAETALVYQVLAAFGDSRLPVEFKGDDAGVHDGRAVARAAAAFDRLSPRAQAVVGPLLVPPFYQGSWSDLQERGGAAASGPGSSGVPSRGSSSSSARGSAAPPPGSVAAARVPPCSPRQTCPVSPNWDRLDSRNGKVRVWWRRGLAPGSRSQAEAIADTIDGGLWSKLTGLMGEPLSDGAVVNNGGDGRLDIVLAPQRDAAGATIPYGDCKRSPAYLIVRNADPETLAHELMHAIQYRYDVAGDCSEYDWLVEATAEWAVEHVYPAGNSEHRRAAAFLREPELPLEEGEIERQYGAYVFFFYLARTLGPSVVRAIWDGTVGADSLAAIDGAVAGGLGPRWPDFAVHNWNRQPLDRYVQWDGLAARVEPQTDDGLRLGLVPDRLHHMLEGEGVSHLAARYFRYRFGDVDVRTVGFHNGFTFRLQRRALAGLGEYFEATPLAADQRRGAAVRALVKLEGRDWQVEDWSDEPFRGFCRDVLAERLEELVLVYTNSRHDDRQTELRPQGEPPALWVSNMGCWRWQGTASHVEVGSGIHPHWNGEVTFERARHTNPTILYRQVAGQIHWNYDVTSGDCRYEGSGTSGVLRNFDLGASYNYVISGPKHRKVDLTAVATESGTHTRLCPDRPPLSGMSGLAGVTTFGAGDQGEVSRDGTTVQGQYTTSVGHVDEWRLEAQRE